MNSPQHPSGDMSKLYPKDEESIPAKTPRASHRDDGQPIDDNPTKRNPAHPPEQAAKRKSMHHATCPSCGRAVLPTAVACPDCGEKIFIEHPADLERVRHKPLDLPKAKRDAHRR